MACTCAPSLVALRNEVNALFLRRDKSSDGCCGDAAHAARKSDHNPTGGYAHALDIDEDIEPGRDLLWLKPILLDDHRTKYVIYEGRIAYPDGADKPYTGPNAHLHHLHLSIKSTATFDTRRWIPPGTTTTPPPRTEEDFTMAGLSRLDAQKGVIRHGFRTILLRNPASQDELDWHLLALAQHGYEAWVRMLVESDEGKVVLARERAAAGLPAA